MTREGWTAANQQSGRLPSPASSEGQGMSATDSQSRPPSRSRSAKFRARRPSSGQDSGIKPKDGECQKRSRWRTSRTNITRKPPENTEQSWPASQDAHTTMAPASDYHLDFGGGPADSVRAAFKQVIGSLLTAPPPPRFLPMALTFLHPTLPASRMVPNPVGLWLTVLASHGEGSGFRL